MTTLDDLIDSSFHIIVSIDTNIKLDNHYTAKAYLHILNSGIKYIETKFNLEKRDDFTMLKSCFGTLEKNYKDKFKDNYNDEEVDEHGH